MASEQDAAPVPHERRDLRPWVEVAIKVYQDDFVHPQIVRDDIAEVLHALGYAFSADWIDISPGYREELQ